MAAHLQCLVAQRGVSRHIQCKSQHHRRQAALQHPQVVLARCALRLVGGGAAVADDKGSVFRQRHMGCAHRVELNERRLACINVPEVICMGVSGKNDSSGTCVSRTGANLVSAAWPALREQK